MRQFGEVTLVCDTPGKRLLIDQLGLPFTRVIVGLDDAVTPNGLEHVWAAGKLKAYSIAAREGPFIHLDFDVVLRKPLPAEFLAADLFVQSEENFAPPSYLTERGVRYVIPALRQLPYLPPCIRVASVQETHQSHNFGIFGGHDIGTIEAYVRCARETLFHESNVSRVQGFNGTAASMFLEQYFLGPVARERGTEITCLLDPACTNARALGYAHYLGPDKFLPKYRKEFLQEVCREFPNIFRQLPR